MTTQTATASTTYHPRQVGQAPQPPAHSRAQSPQKEGAWGADGFTFGDLIDIINPLQHIPVVSTLYRNLTGDELAQGARIIGDALFGGPLGFIASLVNTAVEDETGKDIGDHMLAMVTGGEEETPASPMLAQAPVNNTGAAPVENTTLMARHVQVEITPSHAQPENLPLWQGYQPVGFSLADIEEDAPVMGPLDEFISAYQRRSYENMAQETQRSLDI